MSDVTSVQFSPDGKWLATTAGGLRLWAVDSWQPGVQVGGDNAFAFSPDSKLLAADTGYGSVRLVDPVTGLRVRLLPSSPNPFSTHTTLSYEILASSTPDARTAVRLTVFDVQGKVVKRVVDATHIAIQWGNFTAAANVPPAGTYKFLIQR